MLTKLYLCPSDKKYACSWEGSSNDIIDHFNIEHDDLISYTNTININLSVVTENYLFFLDTEIYLLQIKVVDAYLQIFLRYLGPLKIATNLNFNISIENGERKLDQHNIQVQENFFAVSLECIKTYFGDINFINCVVSVHGQTKSTSSDDGVGMDDDRSVNISIDRESISTTPSVEKEMNELMHKYPDVVDTKSHLINSHDTRIKSDRKDSSATWYGELENLMHNSESPKDHSNLQRSSSCASTQKQRSSAKRSASTLRAIKETDLDLELRCTSCTEHISIPIFMCKSKHNICEYCYRDQKYCNMCNEEITTERNLDLEKRSEGHRYTCRNKPYGCPESKLYSDIKNHEINCTFCLYLCPVEQCGFKGPYKQIVSHLNLIHSSVKIFESFIAVFSKYSELFLVNEKMGIFYCSMSISDEKVTWTAKFSGPAARKFFCELKFKGKTFKYPLLLTKCDDYYVKEMPITDMKEQKLKSKNSILTMTRL